MNKPFRFLYAVMALLLIVQMSCVKGDFKAAVPPQDDDTGDVTPPPDPQPVEMRKVLVIGIDGCRGDAMKVAEAPNIHELLPNAIYSFDAVTQAPTISGPGWSSMLTGVWSNKHGVLNNDFSSANYETYPALYHYLNALQPGIHTVSICNWSPVNQYLAVDAGIRINAKNDAAVKDSAVACLKNADPDMLFLHFDEVDGAGHSYGYDLAAPRYMGAINKTDTYVGEILAALRSRKDIAKESWLIVVATDHGGKGTSHGGASYTEKNIFAIFHNKHFSAKEVLPGPDAFQMVELSDDGAGQYAFLTDFYDVDKYAALTIRFQVMALRLSGDIPFITNKNWVSGMNRGFVINIKGQSWKVNISDGNKRIDVDALNVPDLNDGRWHTLTAVFDRNGDMTIFQDGVKCGSAGMPGLTTIRPPEDTPIKLVMNEDITGGYGKSSFIMANVKIWDAILSDSYIAANSCDTAIKDDDPYKDKLLGWWKCFERDGNLFKDYAGGGYDFKLSSPPEWIALQKDFCNTDIPLNQIAIVDIMPTIVEWLGFQVDYDGWKLDGKSWLPSF
ncbi:MAG TPA: alkaline phosphatase family protein [Agriterribacter sp.]|nr:alkaline phosphatase family protein [Agriterribacter sp.]HRQ50056.1 alkaline phosphatase family protein [Agriterribacter sp.]